MTRLDRIRVTVMEKVMERFVFDSISPDAPDPNVGVQHCAPQRASVEAEVLVELREDVVRRRDRRGALEVHPKLDLLGRS